MRYRWGDKAYPRIEFFYRNSELTLSLGPEYRRDPSRSALEVVEDIEINTKPIWQLNTTNKVAGELLEGATR